MIEKLPPAYIEKMKQQLQDEFEAFIGTYRLPRTQGLRLNPLKISPRHPLFEKLKEAFRLAPVPWCPDGFYYEEEQRPGKHPYHAAGLYYIQEPSAMSAVEMLDPRPGDLVLDLAAAPGGKSTQIAGKLKGQGLLVANEIHPKRAVALSENIERMGIANAVVTVSPPERLKETFPHFFDKILLDAPCSGEGMFRKDPETIGEWSPEYVKRCAARQGKILDEAAAMLKPGGTLVYSTCTFSREENEDVITAFVRRCPEFSIVRMERIWPHLQRGEGHFVALLRKEEEAHASLAAQGTNNKPAPKGKDKRRGEGRKQALEAFLLFEQFCKEAIPDFQPPGDGEPVLFGEQLYWLPGGGGAFFAEHLEGIRVLRPGLHLAEVKKNRIEPSHALALALDENRGAAQQISWDAESEEIRKYLKGETLLAKGVRGWCTVHVNGFPLGWAKGDGGLLKNRYPKGLRWLA